MSFDYKALVTDRTQADVQAKNDKGKYTAVDFNRVTAAVEDLSAQLASRGYQDPYEPVEAAEGRTEWKKEDMPTEAQAAGYLTNVRRIRAALRSDAPLAPSSLLDLTVEGANNIEKILAETSRLLPLIDKSNVMSGEAMSENLYFESAGGAAEAVGAAGCAGESFADSGTT